jgi:serine/threonine protein kinase
MSLTLAPGAIVIGRYRLEQMLGRGGMGEVWAAEQMITRKRVALKFLVGKAAEDPDTRKRFLREARAACAVRHPNVVEVHDVIELEEGVPALVMELLKGESLESKLQRDGKLPVDEALSILVRVVSAVGTAHTAGVWHRDLKPDNIFLAETPEGIEVKVLDFGIAKIATSEGGAATAELTATGAMLGTPYYMSPEQAFGEKRIDHRSDIWSLGIVMYRCLTGQLPTKADNLGQIMKIIMVRSIPRLAESAPELPRSIAELVDRMLGYEPSERPADLREVKAVIEAHLRVRVTDFGPPAIDASSLAAVTSSVRDARAGAVSTPARRFSSGALALAAAGLLAVATAGVVMFRGDRESGAAASGAPISPSNDGLQASSTPSSIPSSSIETAVPTVTATASVVVTPSVSGGAPPGVPPRVPGGPLPSARPSVAAPTATATASSGWGGIVEKPEF